jgi:hypothetical protein
MIMRARTWAPVATFVAVAAAGTAVALVHDGGPAHRDGPKNLRLATAGALGAPVASGSGSGAGSGYVLDVTLPSDKPADQRAYDLSSGPADAGLVTRLADALHAGEPVRRGDAWQAGGLTVSGRAGQAWSWSSCAPPTPVSPDGATSGSGCAVSGGVVEPGATPPPDVPESTVRAAVRDVFASLGLDLGSARVATSPYGVSATTTTDGVVGLGTSVAVDRTGSISYASGWLGTRTPGDTYPVVSAQEAYSEMPVLAHPDICQVAPGGKGCVEPEPVHITGAQLGLSVQATTDGGSVLVPSWLFTTKPTGVVAVVAVERQYRTSQEPPRDLPATVQPMSVEPAPPAPQAKPTR